MLGAHFGSIKALWHLWPGGGWPLPVTVSGNRKLAFAASTASVFSGLYAVELLLDAGPTDRAQLKRGRTIPARAQMPAGHKEDRFLELGADNAALLLFQSLPSTTCLIMLSLSTFETSFQPVLSSLPDGVEQRLQPALK